MKGARTIVAINTFSKKAAKSARINSPAPS
jgi:hypothetical protein